MNPEQFDLEVLRGSKSKKPLWIFLCGLGSLFILMLLALLSPISGKLRRKLSLEKEPEPRVVEKIVEKEVRVEVPVVPERRVKSYQLQNGTDVLKMSNGLRFNGEFKAEEGDLASRERKKKDSYEVNYQLKVKAPRASQKIEELAEVNEHLPKILPGLEGMLAEAKVSPFYETLYANKAKRSRDKMFALDDLLTAHNYYDCETMLEMDHVASKRKVFLMQADMDVVADGSDGDRLAEMPDEIVNSTHYQPFTSYGWKKKTETPNPMVAGWVKRVASAKRELAAAGTSASRKRWLRDRLKMLEEGIDDMKKRSFLIAEHDPFIVMPVNIILDRESAHLPNVGDYALVIYEDQIYPAIVGDGGPTFKVGEASVRMAREIDERAGPYRRPVSTLAVTYLVFPRSGPETRVAPDYEVWKKKCEELLSEIGGLGEGYQLHTWTDTLKKEEIIEPPSEAEGGIEETAVEEGGD